MPQESAQILPLENPSKNNNVSSLGDMEFMNFLGANKSNYFTVLFYLLLSSMQTRQNTVIIQSKDLVLNANNQNQLNKQMASIKFAILHANATSKTIQQVQQENQEFAALRDDIQNDLITDRQTAEVETTQTSTNVNILEQDASEDSGWLKTLSTVFQVIDEMTQNG